MTVQTSNSKTIALGNGIATQFDFSFVGVAAAYIGVIYSDASGNETVLSEGSGTTQYEISLNAAAPGAIWGVGGVVTYNPNGTPIAAGTTLTIFRALPLTQAISLQNQISLTGLGNGAETGLDTTEMQLQQVSENIARAIVAPITDATPPAPLPPIAQRANMGAAFDGNGNLIAGATPASGIISSAMQPVVDAATLALGRAVFGLGTMAQENIGAGLQDDGSGNARVNFPLVQISVGETIAAGNHLTQIVATGPLTLTLSKTSTLWNGFAFFTKVVGGAVTLTPNAADTINYNGVASGTSVLFAPGSRILVTCDGNGNWYVYNLGVATPTTTILTSSSVSPYAVKSGCTRLKIRMVGDGGGGSGAGSSFSGGSAAAGAGATFNGITAAGGAAATANGAGNGGTAGAGGTGGAGSATLRVQGNGGLSGWGTGSSSGNVTFISPGGASFFGGASAIAPPGANSGAGGAGGHSTGATAGNGGGGGAGEYVEFTISAPLAVSYAFSVGAGGAGGSAGTSGTAGNQGAGGLIVIDEYYDGN